MHRAFGAAEEPPRLVRGEVGHDLAARHELVADALEAMRVHDRGHHLAVDGERHVHAVALDEGGPVLVAERVAELDAGAQGDVGRDPAISSRWMIITSRRLIRATTARAAFASHSSTSPLRMNVPRSSDTASSTPPAVFLRKRFFCASQ